VLLVTCSIAADGGADLQSLYDKHQWFRLRDAVQGAAAPPFFQAAVACVFNDLEGCERDIQRYLESSPPAKDAC
jgi:hypothetical protein